MSVCLNPNCLYENPLEAKYCFRCGNKLLLSDRYRAVKRLGRGAFGRTFLATDEHRLKSLCVIKQFIISPEKKSFQKAVELFQREATLLGELGSNSQIPQLLAFLTQDNQMYLVQEYIDGQDLAKELQLKQKYTEVEVRQFLQSLLPVLEFIHSRQVIHRDIKPENIIRRRQDNALVLIDFGVSKQIDLALESQPGTITGTLGYIAPEQIRGVVYYSTDIYALGVTCIRLLTGCLPRSNGLDDLYDPHEMDWVWHDKVNISDNLREVLDKMLVQNPKKRYQSATEVLQALKAPQVPPILNSRAGDLPSTLKPTVVSFASSTSYDKLEQFLRVQNFRQADFETYQILLRLANREKEQWLRDKDFSKIPCGDLRGIDQLWLKYSNNVFGFSVQRKIWQNLRDLNDNEEKIWQEFGLMVGWCSLGQWVDYNKLRFSLVGASGQFPARVFWLEALQTWSRFSLGPHLLDCNI